MYILTNPATLRVLWLIKANVNEYACVCADSIYPSTLQWQWSWPVAYMISSYNRAENGFPQKDLPPPELTDYSMMSELDCNWIIDCCLLLDWYHRQTQLTQVSIVPLSEPLTERQLFNYTINALWLFYNVAPHSFFLTSWWETPQQHYNTSSNVATLITLWW